MASGIYIIENLINGRLYIGSAINVSKRWVEHRSLLNSNTHYNAHLQSAWLKYGSESFAFKFVEAVEPEQLIAREQYYLDTYWSKGLYNKRPTANSPLGTKHTEETKKKISLAGMGNTRTLGHKLTEEHKLKISVGVNNRPDIECICKYCHNIFYAKNKYAKFFSDKHRREYHRSGAIDI